MHSSSGQVWRNDFFVKYTEFFGLTGFLEMLKVLRQCFSSSEFYNNFVRQSCCTFVETDQTTGVIKKRSDSNSFISNRRSFRMSFRLVMTFTEFWNNILLKRNLTPNSLGFNALLPCSMKINLDVRFVFCYSKSYNFDTTGKWNVHTYQKGAYKCFLQCCL